jgi:hypothetical protein
MANYRKSFNLRNGVQVDDDNFIVNANGLVGIGTSIPTEFLDVRGNVKVVGLVTASRVSTPNLQVTGVGTFATLTDGTVRISSGIVTASSGIVTYYGDGKGLTNIPTSQWVDVNTGTGYSSIYAAGTVGIATTMPNYFLQVGGNPDTISGVGINSTGDIKATGIITASSFVGSGIGVTQINASNIESGILSNSRLPSNINISGVITATSGFSGNVTGNVIGIASTALSLSGTPNISVGVVTASRISVGFATVGIATIFTELDVGIGGTAFVALNSGRIGIGTALPTSELQIRKESNPLLEVLSNTDQARISIGQSVGVGKSTAVLRFGSESKTFDIINNDTGNINLYLHAGPSGINTGRFAWLYGQSNVELASLTYDGNFGIGITNPTSNLHVVGTSTVTGNANFGSNVTINGTLSATSLNLSSISANLVGNVYATSGISTFNNLRTVGNILVSSGSSIGLGTDRPSVDFDARNKRGLFGSVGIGTTTFYGSELLGINGSILIPAGNVGIGTTYLNPAGAALQIQVPVIDLYDSHLNLSSGSVGFSTYEPKAVFDFGNVGSATTRPVMVVPNIGDSTRNGIGQTPSGSIIFNTNTLKFQGYTGVAWTDFH